MLKYEVRHKVDGLLSLFFSMVLLTIQAYLNTPKIMIIYATDTQTS